MRFHSELIERRLGQYRRMSRGRFLKSEKDINVSKKIMKIKSLIMKRVENKSAVLSAQDDPAHVTQLREKVEEIVGEANSLHSYEDSKQVSDSVAGQIVHKTAHLYRDCCRSELTSEMVNTEYVG